MRKKGIRKAVPWIVLGCLALVLGLMPVLARNAAESEKASVLSATVRSGEIENTLAGGGTLTAEELFEVKLPATVEIEEYLVENGDHVEEGEAVARVDRVTLLGAMAEVQESLNTVAGQMREASGAATEAKLTAQTAGRVKAVYAQIGDEAKQVVLEHGALAVVSLDGMMVTEIQSDVPVRAGGSLILKLPDGKELIGRVETALEGKLTVTLTDDGPVLGDRVTAYTEEGTEVGSGTLAVHNPWNLIATDGTVNYVYVRENQMVYAGSGIVSVNELNGNARFQSLAAKHREYEEMLQKLFALYRDDTVKAPISGFVSGIEEEKASNTAASGNYRIMLLADSPPTVNAVITGVNGDSITAITAEEPLDISNLDSLLTLISGGNTNFTLPEERVPEDYVPAVGDVVLLDSADAPTVIVFSTHVELGSLIDDVTELNEMISQPIPEFDIDALQQQMAGLMSGFGAGIPAATEQEEDDGLYELTEQVILSLTPDNAMTVSIRVDEHDILEYETGMPADVTVDALPGQSFRGEVTEIGALGENSGGSSKYTVKLRLNRASNMLDGMNASVVVHRGSRAGLILPAEAVYDRGSRSYVCLALDAKTGKPTGEVQVETGLSDGTLVEIRSGLTEGQTVFYEYFLPAEDSLEGRAESAGSRRS